MITAEEYMKQHLGGNMNVSTLTPFAIQEMMVGFANEVINNAKLKKKEGHNLPSIIFEEIKIN